MKENGAAVDYLFDHLLQPLLELTAVHGPGHEAAHIQHEDAFVQQGLRHISVNYALREPFDDGGLAYTRFPNQRGIVLRATAENLNDTLDLHLPADNRVEAPLLGRRGQVQAQLVDQRRLGLFLLFLFGLGTALQQIAGSLRADTVKVDAEAAQHVDGNAVAIPHEPEQQMLGADIMVAHHAGLFDCQLNDTFRARRQRRLPKRRTFPAADGPLDGAHNLARLHAQLLEHLDGDAVFLLHQAKQQMLGADMGVIQSQCLLLSKRKHSPRTFREAFEFIRHKVDSFNRRLVLRVCKWTPPV